MKMQIDEILYELERAWEAGSLPGRQTAERNSHLARAAPPQTGSC
jgi:hypothetical protein